MSEDGTELLRDKLAALSGIHLSDAEVVKLLSELLGCGGSITLELPELRAKLIRREGRFCIKKDDQRRSSSMPPKGLR